MLIKPFWIFGIDRTVQNLVGDESYGMYFALLNFSLILNILLDIGITNYNNRNIAQHNFLLPKHLSNIVGLKFLLAFVYAAFSLTIGAIIGYDKIQFHLLFFLILNQFLISFTLYLRSNISGLQLFRTDSIVSVLDRSFMIIICSVLLFTDRLRVNFSIQWFVYAQTAAYLLTTLIALGLVLKQSGRIQIRFNLKFFYVFLRKSYPYALLVLLMSFYNRLDSVLLERLLPDPLGKQQAGIYAHAFRLLDAASMFGLLFAGLLLPIFSRMIKLKEHVGQMVQLAFTLLIVPALILAISSIFYSREIMALLYTSDTRDSAAILGILMTGFIGIATSHIFGTLLTANGSLKYLNLMALAGMLINIVLNVIWIPQYQAYGSAYASLITQILTASIQVGLALFIFKMKPSSGYVLRLLAFAALTVLFAFVSKYFDNWVPGYLSLIVASLIAASLLKLFNLPDLYKIIRYE